jgi:hypothetical protein
MGMKIHHIVQCTTYPIAIVCASRNIILPMCIGERRRGAEVCDDWRRALTSQRHSSTLKTRAITPDRICHASQSNRDCPCSDARGTRDGRAQVAPPRSSRAPAPHVKILGTRTPMTHLQPTPLLTETRTICVWLERTHACLRK